MSDKKEWKSEKIDLSKPLDWEAILTEAVEKAKVSFGKVTPIPPDIQIAWDDLKRGSDEKP